MARKRKIGVVGGTFDPIHVGHLVLADQVRERLKLDKVIFIPCFTPPHKTPQRQSLAQHRFEMTKLAIEDNPLFSISDIELKRKGLSYTVDTLVELKTLYPDSQICFITGSDVINELEAWKDPEEIFKLAEVVIATRPRFDDFDHENHFVKKSIIVKITGLDISSSEIREKVKKGLSIKYLVPLKVEEYIEYKKLYRR